MWSAFCSLKFSCMYPLLMYRCEKYLAPYRLDSSSFRVGMVCLVLLIYLLTSVMARLATVLWSEDHITAPICQLISYILYDVKTVPAI